MNLIHEYALLVAVALPVVVIVGVQVFLFVSGERGTLLLPGLSRFPTIELPEIGEETTDTTPAASAVRRIVDEVAANDDSAKEAA